MNKLINLTLLGFITFGIMGCHFSNKKGLYTSGNPSKYQGYFKSGRAYSVITSRYRDKNFNYYVQTGIASWYGANDGFHGKITANGDYFISNGLTAAHKTLPLPSMVRVTNMENGKKLIVMVNDRGPYHGNRLLDLSERAADILKIKHKGTGRVKVEYMPDATNKLLKKLCLKPVNGYYAKTEMMNKECSVQCYLNHINRKKNYIQPHEDIHVAEISKYPGYFIPDKDKNAGDKNINLNDTGNKPQNYIVKLDLSGLKNNPKEKNKLVSYLNKIHNVKNSKSGGKELVMLGPINDEMHAVKIAVHLEELTGLNAEIEYSKQG